MTQTWIRKVVVTVLDGLLLAVAFLVALKLGDQASASRVVVTREFLVVVIPVWFAVTLVSAKFSAPAREDYSVGIRRLLRTQFLVAVLVASGLYLTAHPLELASAGADARLSGPQTIFSALLIHLMLELGLHSVWHYWALRRNGSRGLPFEVVLMAVDFAVIAVLFLALNVVWLGSLVPEPTYPLVLLTIVATWLVISTRVHGFRVEAGRRLVHALAPFVASQLFVIGVVILVFVWIPYRHSRLVVFGTLIGFALIENAVVFIYHTRLRRRATDAGMTVLRTVSRYPAGDPPTDWIGAAVSDRYSVPPLSSPLEAITSASGNADAGTGGRPSIRSHLDRLFGARQAQLLMLLDRTLDLDRFNVLQTVVVATDNERSVKMFAEGVFELFINLERVNNVLSIDRFFHATNGRLCPGGVLVGSFQTQAQRRQRQWADHHIVVAAVMEAFDFFWRRVCSKLPLIRDVHFVLTKGHDRVLSLTECMGRLGFAGFEVIGLETIGDAYTFVARKVQEVEDRKSPEYGLMFRQQRVGHLGRPIEVFKLRTMYPYAEFLHLRLIRERGLAPGGKTNEDFRITGWGRLLRKFWIDEFPMVFNLLRGDLKLVGVRPISRTFFELYPEDLKRERVKVRPGLIPPFYADMPADLEGVFESERRYLERYRRSPWRCDLWYLAAAGRNIVFRQARSS